MSILVEEIRADYKALMSRYKVDQENVYGTREVGILLAEIDNLRKRVADAYYPK